ncbi:gas41 [Babesia ovis]|uniref:Gas41 n=1 Tax=Babesia ovis TaxID=5869 RepID=A0A9W5T8R0_BABOV|nr:gas41 [Babesia ovis]
MVTKNTKRVNVKVGKQIAVGTYAFPLTPLEKKRYGSMTHRWTCLLRSPTNENMTHYIKKVQFDLDPSFINPRRVLTAMPYEVTEVGWGEFYIGVKIFFVDETIEPVQLQHLLVLNPPENNGLVPSTATNETFDEIIFNEPSSWFYKQLMYSTTDILPPHRFQDHFWDHTVRDKETTCRYICCQSYFQNETYRLLAEASELARQIQYLQERANAAKNQTTTPAAESDNKIANATNQNSVPGGPTCQTDEIEIKAEKTDAISSESQPEKSQGASSLHSATDAVSTSPKTTSENRPTSESSAKSGEESRISSSASAVSAVESRVPSPGSAISVESLTPSVSNDDKNDDREFVDCVESM